MLYTYCVLCAADKSEQDSVTFTFKELAILKKDYY